MHPTLDQDTPRDPGPGASSPAPPSPGLSRAERAAQRREQLRRRRIIGGVVGTVLVLVLAGGGWLVWGTSVLGVTDVDVAATAGDLDPVLAAAVADVAAVAPGTPLIRVDLDAVRDRVETVLGVDSAEVSRHWPGTVQVTVTPRVPVAVVAANSALYLMDADGVPYTTVTARPAGLVSLRLATPGPGDPATTAGLAVIRSLPADLVPLVASVTASSPYDITLQLTDQRTVVWGADADNALKAHILPAVLQQPGTSFDITDPGRVSVR